MNCPDCGFTIKEDATKCRCGWVKPAAGGYVVAGEPRPICRTVGCRELALVGKPLCDGCDERIRQERSTAFCEAKGLRTLDEKREFCRRLVRGWTPPSFEQWADTITQRTVDLIAIHAGHSDKRCLERLRNYGVIDQNNRVISPEKRVVKAERSAA